MLLPDIKNKTDNCENVNFFNVKIRRMLLKRLCCNNNKSRTFANMCRQPELHASNYFNS